VNTLTDERITVPCHPAQWIDGRRNEAKVIAGVLVNISENKASIIEVKSFMNGAHKLLVHIDVFRR
jgi:hypothetical protein